jgi:hypothetical protein
MKVKSESYFVVELGGTLGTEVGTSMWRYKGLQVKRVISIFIFYVPPVPTVPPPTLSFPALHAKINNFGAVQMRRPSFPRSGNEVTKMQLTNGHQGTSVVPTCQEQPEN